MGKVKLDRSNWSTIQFGSGVPTGATPGNIYFDSSSGDVYYRRSRSHSWAKSVTGYWGRAGTVLSPLTSGDTAQAAGFYAVDSSAAVLSAQMTGNGAEEVARLELAGEDSATNREVYGYVAVDAVTTTSGAEDGKLEFGVVWDGVLTEFMSLNNGGTGDFIFNSPDGGDFKAYANGGNVLIRSQGDGTGSPISVDLIGQGYSSGERIDLDITSTSVGDTNIDLLSQSTAGNGLITAITKAATGTSTWTGGATSYGATGPSSVTTNLYALNESTGTASATLNVYTDTSSGPSSGNATGNYYALADSGVAASSFYSETDTGVESNTYLKATCSGGTGSSQVFIESSAVGGNATSTLNAKSSGGTARVKVGFVSGSTGPDQVQFADVNVVGSTWAGTQSYLELSDSQAEWSTLHTNFTSGSSLISMLNTLFASGGGTLDDAYDFGGAGSGRTIDADSGAVRITVDDTDNNNVLELQSRETTNNNNLLVLENQTSGSSNPDEACDIYITGTDSKIIAHNVDSLLVSAVSDTAPITAGFSAASVTAGVNTLTQIQATSTTGTCDVVIGSLASSSGNAYVGVHAYSASGSSSLEVGRGEYAGPTYFYTDEVRFSDINASTSTWSNLYLTLSDNTTEWDNLETNCGGEVSLIQAINLAFSSSASLTWSGTTSNATPTEIFVNGVSLSRYTLTASQTDAFFLKVIARDSTNNKSKVWEIKAAAQRDSSNNSALVDTPIYEIVAQSDTTGTGTGTDTWDVAVSVDDTDETFRVTVTGYTDASVGWVVVG